MALLRGKSGKLFLDVGSKTAVNQALAILAAVARVALELLIGSSLTRCSTLELWMQPDRPKAKMQQSNADAMQLGLKKLLYRAI